MNGALPRIAVVDDEPGIRALLESELREAGFDVQTATDALSGLGLVRDWEPDLILLDVMMPKVDGISIIPRYRAMTQAPIFIVSAKGGTEDKVLGLERGADQYVAKPFEMPELVARIRSAMRRPILDNGETLAYHDLVIDLRAYTVTREGVSISLTRREFDLLVTLVRQPRRVFTREQLMDIVWGSEVAVSGNAVETYISYLRSKIDVPFPQPLIHTVRGVGYSLRAD